MRPFAGTGGMLRLALRRERWWIIVTALLFAGTYLATAAQMATIAPDRQDRVEMQQSIAATPGFRLLLGDLDHPDTIASTVSWRIGLFMAGALAVLAALTVVRHTRAEEETGRQELLAAGRLGRLATLTAAVVVAVLMLLVTGAASAAALLGRGATAGQVAGHGLALTLPALAAIGLAAVTAQVSTAARTAKGIAVSAVLLAYVLRGVTDLRGRDTLTGLNPFGWYTELDPFGDPRWWPVAAAVACGAVLVVLAGAIAVRRDLGSGLLQVGAGRPRARLLSGPTTLALRLGWRNFAGWLVVVLLFGVFVGSLKPDLVDFAATTPQFEEILTSLGGEGAILDAYEAVMAQLFGIAAACWAIAQVGTIRGEESAGRLENVLATRVPRVRLLLANAALAFAGVVVLQLAVGLASGLVGGGLGDSVAAELVRVPPAWLLLAVALLLVAWRPAWSWLAWLLALTSVLFGIYGDLLGIPDWLRQFSVFQHVPNVPVDPLRWTPLVVMTLVAVALVALAAVCFRRRDVPANPELTLRTRWGQMRT